MHDLHDERYLPDARQRVVATSAHQPSPGVINAELRRIRCGSISIDCACLVVDQSARLAHAAADVADTLQLLLDP
jgi:hypothetical protein